MKMPDDKDVGVHRVGRSVRDLLGALTTEPALEEALADQRRIDPELWQPSARAQAIKQDGRATRRG
jgi:hypothetical protein